MEDCTKNGSTATFINAKYAGGKRAVIAEAKARKAGGRVVKEVGRVDGGNAAKHAGRASRTVTGGKPVHGMPLMSSASRKT